MLKGTHGLGLFDSFVPDLTVGKVSTDRQYKKFSGTEGGFFCTVGI